MGVQEQGELSGRNRGEEGGSSVRGRERGADKQENV